MNFSFFFLLQGLVPAGLLLTLMQWGGRTHFLLAIVRQIPEVRILRSIHYKLNKLTIML